MTDETQVMVFVLPREGARGSLRAVDRMFSSVGGDRWLVECGCLMFEPLGKIVSEQMRERQFEVDAFHALLAYPYPLEERLVSSAS